MECFSGLSYIFHFVNYGPRLTPLCKLLMNYFQNQQNLKSIIISSLRSVESSRCWSRDLLLVFGRKDGDLQRVCGEQGWRFNLPVRQLCPQDGGGEDLQLSFGFGAETSRREGYRSVWTAGRNQR